jgi:HSP20 family protein
MIQNALFTGVTNSMSISFVRWQPWQEMETVQRQLNQLFEEMTPIARETLVQHRPVRVPPIELSGTDTDLILKVELPGIEGKDLDIQVTRESVSIKGAATSSGSTAIVQPEGETPKGETPEGETPEGETTAEITAQNTVKPAEPHLYRSEFRTQTFHRVVPLPVEVDNENTQADFKNGILTLTLPKLVRDRNHAVKVALDA